ncbi:MAG: 1-deoxy-D-xylulose-5-phosphate reductoisomerase, partial [Candidatus Ornithomonoglobus sp.]
TFDEPDTETFYALELAKQAGRAGEFGGSTLATVFNSADEEAVKLFMQGKLSYLGITDAIAYAMEQHKTIINPSLEDIYNADKEAREIVKSKFAG